MISRENILEFDKRRNIYQLILKNPGLHERKISRELNIPRSTLKYHLHFLKKRDLLVSHSTNQYNSFFIKGKVGRYDKKFISLFQKGSYRSIIMFMLFRVNTTISEIAIELEKHPNTINSHIKKLINNDIIETVPIENNIIPQIATPVLIEYIPKTNEKLIRLKDPNTIYDLALTYKGQLEEKFVLDMISEGLQYYTEHGFPKRKSRPSVSDLDAIFEQFYEAFPIFFRA